MTEKTYLGWTYWERGAQSPYGWFDAPRQIVVKSEWGLDSALSDMAKEEWDSSAGECGREFYLWAMEEGQGPPKRYLVEVEFEPTFWVGNS